jgi:hypothetical protein
MQVGYQVVDVPVTHMERKVRVCVCVCVCVCVFVCFNEEYRDTEHERAGTVCVRVFNLLDMFAFNVPTAINATTLHI